MNTKQVKQQELALFPRWPRAKPYRLKKTDIKALVRHRDGYRCRECGMTAKEHFHRYCRALEVHRIVPGSKYTLRGCVTLCQSCHKTKPKSPRKRRKEALICCRIRKDTVVLQLRMDQQLAEALENLAVRNLRPRNTEVVVAIEQYLSSVGLWPASNS